MEVLMETPKVELSVSYWEPSLDKKKVDLWVSLLEWWTEKKLGK